MDDKKPRGSSRNRRAGHDWERKIVKMLKERELYPHAVSSRSESKSLDDAKIDVMNHEEHKNGVMYDSIQAKNVSKTLNYRVVLGEMLAAGRPGNVIFHKLTTRSKNSNTFLPQGEFAITELENYLELMACRLVVKALKAGQPVEGLIEKYKL